MIFAGITNPPPVEPVPAEAQEPVPPVAAAPAKGRKRARTPAGTFQGDDPGTPDVNEAWTSQ